MNLKIIAFLRVIRYRNLLIVAMTQYLMRFAIIKPILGINNFELQMDEFHFFLLVLVTILITAAGYVINDYFDTRADLLNRPGSVIIDREIPRRTAIIIHWIFNFSAIILGFYLSFYIGVPVLGLLFVIVTGLLWFYSTTYNRQFLTGNIIISILTAMVPVMVIVFEIPLLNREYGNILRLHHANLNHVFAWVGSFGYFAFLTNLTREIIKDIEDYKGDVIQGRRSVPIVLGISYAKTIIGALIIIIIISLAYLYKAYLMIGFSGGTDYLSLLYFIIFLVIPLAFLLFMVIRAREREDYTLCNSIAKFIMLSGIMYSLLVRYIISTSF
jgi:4-hydroxybenzoate polyprenyltransferase